jgi:hypothetical protein
MPFRANNKKRLKPSQIHTDRHGEANGQVFYHRNYENIKD